MTLDY